MEKFLDYFQVEYKRIGKQYQCVCPFHDAARKLGGYIIYKNADHTVHLCLTECPKNTKKDAVTFIHKLLNRSSSTSYDEAIKFIYEFLNEEYTGTWKSKTAEELERDVFMDVFDEPEEEKVTHSKITREQIRSKLLIPANYYLDRGYSSEILNAYDVGLCIDKKKKMYDRVVIPCYDETGDSYVGCTARSKFEKCGKCGFWHDENKFCPITKFDMYKSAKWLHDPPGALFGKVLFNTWKAKDEIRKTRKAIICEGPGDCIKLASLGIHNSLGVFGNCLKPGQIQILDSLGVMDLIVMLDNDEAGIKGAEQIKETCGRFYRLYFPKLKGKDAGEIQTDSETEDIKNLLNRIGI